MSATVADMGRLAATFHGILASLVAEGYTAPMVVVMVGANGAVSVMRLVADPGGDGFHGAPVAQDYSAEGFTMPINLVICDSQGRGSHHVVGADYHPTAAGSA